jgi:hypothetical protein
MQVQSSRLITSCSVPPQSSFPCPPCSIRLKNDTESSPVRLTYCVLQRPDLQLQCFTDKDEGYAISKVAISAFSLDGTQSPVIYLETIPLYHNPDGQVPCDVVVVHQDGTIRRIAGDLSAQRWSMKILDASNVAASNLVVRAAYWMSEEHAKNSFLKNRPDLHLGRDGRGSSLLALIAKRTMASEDGTQDMIYGIWSVEEQHLSNAFSGSIFQGITPLVLHTLPETKRWRNHDTSQYSFNSINGALSVSFSHGIITYDLSTYAPKVSSNLFLDTTATSYPMRLTSSLVVGSTSSAVNLHDGRFQSIQSTVDLEQIWSKRSRTKRAKANQNSIRFIAYFAKIKRLVAFRGHALIAFDITNNDTQGTSRALPGDGMLIDAVGRGMRSGSPHPVEISAAAYQEIGTPFKPYHHDKASWVSQRHRLDELAERCDIPAFDDLMAKELCNSSDGELFDYGALQLPRYPLYVDQAKINYLISKIFEPFSDVDDGIGESANFGNNLKLGLQTDRLIHWLVLANQLTDRHVERALQRTKSSRAFALRPGAVVFALTRDQPSCEIIIDYLKHSQYLPLSDIIQAAKLLVGDVVANASRVLDPTLLRDGNADQIIPFYDDVNPTGQGEDARDTQRLTFPMKRRSGDTLAHGSSSVALLIALERLGSHSHQDITAELHSQLSQSEILSIIQILRQQLFYGGHTSYLPTTPTSTRSSPKLGSTHTGGASMNLDTILKLLSSCLDATGPVAFLARSKTDNFLEQLIPDLKSEISFAFEGMQETNHLQGLLREVLRYANSARMSNNGHIKHSPSTHSLPEGQEKRGTIVTLYTEPKVDQGDVEGQGRFLPLSLRADNVISTTKVRKGGGQVSKRSRRDIRKLQERNVGNYAFERLVL